MSRPYELSDEEERIREAGGTPRLPDDLKARVLMQATRAKKHQGRMRTLAVLASVCFIACGGALLYDRATNPPMNQIAESETEEVEAVGTKSSASENEVIESNVNRLRNRGKPIPSGVLR